MWFTKKAKGTVIAKRAKISTQKVYYAIFFISEGPIV